MSKYILSLDQGTTSSRAVLYDDKGNMAGMCSRPVKQIYPHSGWVEHDPLDIWEGAVEVMRKVLSDSGVCADDVAAIGIANQRETVIVWDKSGNPVHNAIVWQCRRTSNMCEHLREEGLEDLIYARTGLMVDPYFSATKIRWILDNVRGLRKRAAKGELYAGTVDCYLMYRLTGGRVHATDYTNASRTMLFNIHTRKWDEELLSLFDIPSSMLPDVYPSGFHYGDITPDILGKALPICGVAGDQQAALFGLLCTEEGDIKSTYGTGCFTLMNTGKRNIVSKRGLVTTLAAGLCDEPDYVLEGSIFSSGAVTSWIKDGLRIIDSPADCADIAASVPDTGGVYLVPAFVGLGAPHWDSEARGTITGLTRATTREQLIRAAEECIAYQVLDVLRAVQADTGVKIRSLHVDGGTCADDFIMQFQSDIANIKVIRPVIKESTSLGAAYLAGLTCGMWKSIEQCRSGKETERTFLPNMDKSVRSSLIIGWEHAVRQTRAR